MTSPFFLPGVALIAVLLGGAAFLWGLRLTRRQDRTVSRRVDLVLGRPLSEPDVKRRQPDILMRRTWQERVRDAVRSPFLLGVDHSWGVTLPAAVIVPLAAAAAIIAWIFLRHLFHFPVWISVLAALAAGPLLPFPTSSTWSSEWCDRVCRYPRRSVR
jgi:hypothetical protein